MISLNPSELLWVEKYRPKTVADCILPADLKNQFLQVVQSKAVPNMLFVGGPGSGKTTVARAIADELELDHILINASEESGIDTLRTKIRNFASASSFSGNRRLCILDEFDNSSSAFQAALRGSIEEFSGNCSFIMTANFKWKIIDALQSRCPPIEFKVVSSEKPKLMVEFHRRLSSILKQENIKCDADLMIGVIASLFPDFRRILGIMQSSVVDGEIPSSVLAKMGQDQFKELIQALKAKDFSRIRKWIAENSDVDQATVLKQMYDSLYEVLEKDTIPAAVLITGKYLFQAAFVVDQEINLSCYFLELMSACRFK